MEEVIVVKKRGRPAKAGGAAPAAGSPTETVPKIPKKRGRPPKDNKGRGRPPKVPVVKGSDNEDDDPNNEANGDEPVAVSKGRGRPRKVQPQESKSGNEDDDGDSSVEEKVEKLQKTPQSAKRRKLGRPRKHQASDEEDNDDDDEEPRPVGRPATGAVNLNIVRTGRGPGRPKKGGAVKRSSPGDSNGDDASQTVPKKRGRPSMNNKAASPYVPTGRPRGRPKVNSGKPTDDDDDEEEEEEQAASNNEDESAEAEQQALPATPKKRGRPSLAKNSGTPSGKPRGRPKIHKDEDDDEDDDDGDDDAGGKDGETATKSPPRGRKGIKSTKTPRRQDVDDDKEDDDGNSSAAEDQLEQSLVLSKSGSHSSPENGANKSAVDDENEGSVECVSDEASWADANNSR